MTHTSGDPDETVFRRQLLVAIGGSGIATDTAAGQSNRTTAQSGQAELTASVRQNKPTRGKRIYIDVTLTGSLVPDNIDRWLVQFGTGELRESKTLDALLEEMNTSFPMLTRGYVSHRYNDEGTYTVEIVGKQNGEVVYRATTEPFTVQARTRLVHGESWTPNILPSFETTAQSEAWTPNINPVFETPIQSETWTPNISPSFETAVQSEAWTSNIKPSFETTAQSEAWTPNIIPVFETVVQQESWEPSTTGNGNS